MRKLTLLVIGNLKEKFWIDAVCEFEKRLQKFCDFEIVEIAEEKLSPNPTKSEIEKVLEKEAQKLATFLKTKNVFLFCPEGKQVSSEEFSKLVENSTNLGHTFFVIGSSFGLSENLKQKFEKISFGKITLPHRLFRVVAVEQIFRAFSILNNTTYHK